MRYIYNLFWYLILPFVIFRLLWKSRKNSAYRARIAERLGFYNFPPQKDTIWVHAVSVGESISAIPLIKELLAAYPKNTLVVTTMTPTGAERIQKVFGTEVLQLYVPYDIASAVKRFLRHLNPKILVLMETELWPNILYYTARQNIPIIIANARLSEKSFTNYKKVRHFTQSILNCITTVAAQSKIDMERFLDLGLDPKKMLLAGNVKFDIKLPDDIFSRTKQLRSSLGIDRPIWVAASTHPGEEEKVLAAAKLVIKARPETLLILVPRHPERFSEVYEMCKTRGFNVIRYSENKECSSATNILLGDVMGQLLLFYAVSDVAFVGGSLVPWGGHNLLEPAALAKPILSGPYLSAFSEISELFTDAGALIKVADEKALADNLIKLFGDKILQEKLGTRALDVVEKHRGATKKILEVIRRLYEHK